uniref:Orf:PZA114 protein n=1 Tax=Saccharomyces cerevisiae TaxID=4932 RepID=E9PAB6_YEASX|nr:orf:PZA114 [Saccharomyces cerevisiae]
MKLDNEEDKVSGLFFFSETCSPSGTDLGVASDLVILSAHVTDPPLLLSTPLLLSAKHSSSLKILKYVLAFLPCKTEESFFVSGTLRSFNVVMHPSDSFWRKCCCCSLNVSGILS